MRLRQPVEVLYLLLLSRWQRTSPEDGHLGELDGEAARNTQVARLVYLLKKVAVPQEEQTYQRLAQYTRRSDGESYISKKSLWMKEPASLNKDWYFEGCTSLVQKQGFLQALTKLGLSAEFVRCADDFVAGKSIESYFPTDAEAEAMLSAFRDSEET